MGSRFCSGLPGVALRTLCNKNLFKFYHMNYTKLFAEMTSGLSGLPPKVAGTRCLLTPSSQLPSSICTACLYMYCIIQFFFALLFSAVVTILFYLKLDDMSGHCQYKKPLSKRILPLSWLLCLSCCPILLGSSSCIFYTYEHAPKSLTIYF